MLVMPDSAPAPIPAIPVICDKCRAEGHAGDPAFAEIADLLTFTPVPRRAHVNNWTPEHQRAFIAGLAMTGSPKQAARAIGRHAYGAEQLRNAKGGREFAAAWDAALELYRERELFRIRDNLSALAEQQEQRDQGSIAQTHLRALPPPAGAYASTEPVGGWANAEEREQAEYMRGAREWDDSQRRVRTRFFMARRTYLASIVGDPERRAAWDLLCGPADWDAAGKLAAQPDETPPDLRAEAHIPPGAARPSTDLTHLHGPAYQIPLKNGFVPELTDPDFDDEGEPLQQLAKSIRKSDPRFNNPSPLQGSGQGEESDR